MSETICNVTYDQLQLGQSASLSQTIRAEDILGFAAVSGDTNPAHLDPDYAEQTMFGGVIAHGMYSAGLISALLGTRFPGAGTIYLGQELQFKRPVRIGDILTVTLTVADKRDDKKIVTLDCLVSNQNGDKVVTGKATVIAPSTSIDRPLLPTPTLHYDNLPPTRFTELLGQD